GFNYSDALIAHAEGGKTWTYEELNAFLFAPKEDVPGTKMNFGGLKDDQERANVIAYLASISPDAPPFPEPAANAAGEAEAATTEAQAGAVPAEGGDAGATTGDAVATPTETQSETPVQGTPTQSPPANAAPQADAVVPEVPAGSAADADT